MADSCDVRAIETKLRLQRAERKAHPVVEPRLRWVTDKLWQAGLVAQRKASAGWEERHTFAQRKCLHLAAPLLAVSTAWHRRRAYCWKALAASPG